MRARARTAIISLVFGSCLLGLSARPGADDPALVRGPAWLGGCLVYHATFEDDVSKPAVNSAKLAVRGPKLPGTHPDGLFGRALDATETALGLEGDVLSPHRPFTLSFWWTLPEDLPVDGTFSLFLLRGRGIVTAFTRGLGSWCALREPAGVLQVYYFPGIQNVNGIYDLELSKHLDLRGGVWHHTAAVFRRASTVELYTDGHKVTEISILGREFLDSDGVRSLDLGGSVRIDEVMLLDRAIDAEQVADYYRGVLRLHEYDRHRF